MREILLTSSVLILAVLLIVLGLNIVFHSFSAYKKAEHNSEAKI